jgi:hypothetical protein
MHAITQRDAADVLTAVTAPAFTGRDHEMAALTAALAGPPAVVIIEG